MGTEEKGKLTRTNDDDIRDLKPGNTSNQFSKIISDVERIEAHSGIP